MGAKKKAVINSDVLRVILIVLGSAFSIGVLVFAVFAINEIQNSRLDTASLYLFGIFVVLGLSRLVTFLRERTKISFFRFLLLLVYDIALGVILLVAKDNPYTYSMCGGLFCLSIIVSRTFKIIQNHSIRNIVFNAAIILFALLLGIALFIPYEGTNISDVVLLICLIVAISAFIEVISNGTGQIKIRVLFKIMLKTYALEIILGLLTVMIACSLMFVFYEEKITNFEDGLWYSFVVVTTIGFGDFYAKSLVGRILTVILGVYGIVVVAVLTSIIVNFYNETAGKQSAKELKEIKEEEKNK